MSTWACEACGTANPAGTRFCGQCGTPWSDIGESLRSFVTGPLAARLPVEHAFEGEHRLVTALFADLSGFTPLAGRLDPEELLEVIDPVIAALSDVVHRHGGFVEKFAGDALLAVFGAPVSHEDDPARALLVALEMHRELERLRARLPADADELALHIGVNSGRGVARLLGSEARVDYAVLGEAVILAQRLEAAAPPGETYVSDSTYRLARDAFEFEPVGELELKGKTEPVSAWRLLRGRAEARRPRLRPLVGRKREVASLAAVLDKLGAGDGAVVAVLGEPGVGKSRLAEEAQRAARERGLRWLDARCLSYGAALPYWPYSELLRRLAGIRGDDAPAEARTRLSLLLAESAASEALPFFARLLNVGAEELNGMSPESFRAGLHRAFASWLEALAAGRPMVLALDDAHWADASTLELAAQLAPLAIHHPVLFLFTAREEATSALDQVLAAVPAKRQRRLRLEPLANADVVGLVETLLDGAPAPDLVALVDERTGGNPFFVKELVRSLQEERALERDGDSWRLRGSWAANAVPPTIEGVLAARIDRLPHRAAAVLQTAAVIGRRVPLPLLRAVEEGAPYLGASVRTLLESGFLDPAEEDDGRVVVFHHALVQDVAYSRPLRRRRRELHRRVAEAAEALYGAGDDVIELLARHLDLADAGTKAAEYLLRAGDRAKRLFANEEAVTHFRRALAQLARVEPDSPSRRELEARIYESLADVLFLTARIAEARNAYRDALARVPEGARATRARLQRRIANALEAEYRWQEAESAFDDAERTLGPLEDRMPRECWQEWVQIQLDRISVLYWQNKLPEMERLVANARPIVDRHGTALQRSDFFASLFDIEARRERYVIPDEALALVKAAAAAAEESDDPWYVAGGRFTLGFAHLWHGTLDDAERHLLDALDMSERIGAIRLRCRCLTYLATVYRKRHAVEETRHRAGQALEAATDLGMPEYVGMAKANQAWVAWRDGDRASTREDAHAAVETWKRTEIADYPFKWTALFPLLAVAVAEGRKVEAEECVRALLDPTQQPLPKEVSAALDRGELARGLELAEATGFV